MFLLFAHGSMIFICYSFRLHPLFYVARLVFVIRRIEMISDQSQDGDHYVDHSTIIRHLFLLFLVLVPFFSRTANLLRSIGPSWGDPLGWEFSMRLSSRGFFVFSVQYRFHHGKDHYRHFYYRAGICLITHLLSIAFVGLLLDLTLQNCLFFL